MHIYDIITKKKHGEELSDEEIKSRVKLAAEFCGLSEKELKRRINR